MKKILSLFFFFLTALHAHNERADQPYIQTIFNHLKVKTILEFGISGNTRFFLASSNKVISIEFITNGYGPDNLRHHIEKNRDFQNWVPIAYLSGYHGDAGWAPYKYYGTESVYKATSYISANHKSFASIDDFFITEIGAFVTNLKKCYKIEVAHVGGSILIRGDLIQLLFDKVPIIVGTNSQFSGIDFYGYGNIRTPDSYEEIRLGGDTVWVSRKEEYRSLLNALKSQSR